MTSRDFHDVRSAVADQRAAITLDPITARRLVVAGGAPMDAYLASGTRWMFRALGVLAAASLAAGGALLFSGRPLYAALAFLAAIILHHLWGGLAEEVVRLIVLRDASFCDLALREGWVTLVEPPTGPGRKTKPVAVGDEAGAPYEADIAHARAVLAERPDDAATRFDLGVTYLLLGRFDLALEESRILTMTDARLATKLQALTKLLGS